MLSRLKKNIASRLTGPAELAEEELISLLEVPKSLDHGHLAFPTFILAKQKKMAPPKIAQELSEKLSAEEWPEIESITPVGGFLNFSFKNGFAQQILTDSLRENANQLGHSNSLSGKKIIVDYSSPNVAKRMSVGHLRATVIGEAICRLYETQGAEVVRLNHLGDWGTQFGKLAWAIDEWGSEYDFENEPIASLTELYTRFHDEAEKNPKYEEEGASYFKRLEAGEEHLVSLWKKIVEISLKEYDRLWGLLNVKHDLVKGESFYNDLLKPTEDLIEEKGILEESDGAMVVRLDGDKPPCLIRKSDGASLYATRDLASAIHRMKDMGGNENIYVVGQDQTLHFQQVFEVLEKMNYPWAKDCTHVSFGMYRFKDIGRMSTRKGRVITLEDVLSKSIELVKNIIESKNPDLENKELVAQQVGVGAVVFNDLVNDRVKNVDFDWDRALNFDGDSGPYVQYCAVRCKSILRKYDKEVPEDFKVDLGSKEEMTLIKRLLQLDSIFALSHKTLKPHFVANYLLEVCKAFGQFYHHNRVLGESAEIEASRIKLIQCTLAVLEKGLDVLNISAPEEM